MRSDRRPRTPLADRSRAASFTGALKRSESPGPDSELREKRSCNSPRDGGSALSQRKPPRAFALPAPFLELRQQQFGVILAPPARAPD